MSNQISSSSKTKYVPGDSKEPCRRA